MKNITDNSILHCVLLMLVVALMPACEKDSDGSPTVKAGTPVAASLNPDSAAVGTVLTLQGTGLGDMRSIVFDKNNAIAPFYSTLNTGTAIIFSVPDTALRGDQNIVFTNSDGKVLKVPFKVLPFGVVNSAFPTDFEPGTLVTLTGNNLDVVTKIVLSGTTDEATIVSQTLNQAVIKMPASTVARAPLVLTTTAGDKATSMDFVNVSLATAPIFTDDWMNPAQSWSWGGSYDASTDYVVTGTKGLKAAYDPAGTWGGLQIGMGTELQIPDGTKYFSFWARGADVDVNMTVDIKGNHSTTDNSKVITIPAGKWTRFSMEIGSFLPGVSSVSIILFQINGAGKTIYYDNIMFTK